MKPAQVVFLLASVCLIESVSGDAPGDEHRLCLQDVVHSDTENVLLDSNNYINLLTGVFPPPVWKTQSYQPGSDGVSYCVYQDVYRPNVYKLFIFTVDK